MDLNALSNKIEERYRGYLETTFYFKDPQLRSSFEEALASGYLRKGPFLEATPVFKQAETPQALFRKLLGFQPDEGLLRAVRGQRPLYQHQQEAIRKVCEGCNVVVATGTGSGKTEAFLYPILLSLYQEFTTGNLCPGVRALVLYPMNALANDQRERLGEIHRLLGEGNSPFQFSFGQYIGETPEDADDNTRHARDHMANRLPGELVLRSEIRNTPPHILLTNYSMLEYLLLRPQDSPLFDNGYGRTWGFLVLDEAHQYRGARGIEMAMLVRRLKQRLREGGRSQPFHCIATSATLVGREEDKEQVARFASDLFGEPFQRDSVILGTTEPVGASGQESLSPDAYAVLRRAQSEPTEATRNLVGEMAFKLGVTIGRNEDIQRTVAKILLRDRRATDLRRMITGSPVEVQEIAEAIFNDAAKGEGLAALGHLVELLLHARDPVSDAPLMSARYHTFLKSLEGAFVSYWPQKKVFLDRRALDSDSPAFEVALCRECGQHYFVGPKGFKGGRLAEPIRDPSHPDFGATFLRPVENGEDEDTENEGGKTAGGQMFQLCVQCGEASKDTLRCGHTNTVQIVMEESPKDEDRADQIAKCGLCGYHGAGRDPVREVVHGADGPNAVIATTLYQALADQRKKVLAFADGRQEAAFFAWYLEKSYRDILNRNLLLKAIRELNSYAPHGVSLNEMAHQLNFLFKEMNIFPPATGDVELGREAWLSVYREFLTDEQRISLEGVGLIGWSIKWPPWFKTPQVFQNAPWSLQDQEAQDLVRTLLDTMRAEKAVDVRADKAVSFQWYDLGLQTTQLRVRVGQPKAVVGVRSWDGTAGRRVNFLSRLLVRQGLPKKDSVQMAVAALRSLWDHIRQCDDRATSSQDRLLAFADDARRLNPDWCRARPLVRDTTLFQCSVCSRLQTVSIRGVCPRLHCPGTLEEVRQDELKPNHYRMLYEEDLPGSLRVEEHTAQLDKEKAREFQRAFRKGDIHVLSCSTTFELGVDLGDLDTIFLRNVPPEAFNYAQRAGRAGRRSGHPGFVITYCRRGPHDLYHFSEPVRILGGKIHPPSLALHNDKILSRHIVATTLSKFFRAFPNRFKTVENLFEDFTKPAARRDLANFVHTERNNLEQTIHAIVPTDMAEQVGLGDGRWMAYVDGEQSRFCLSEAEVCSDYRAATGLEANAAEKGDYDTAKWARARAATIAGEDVLSFLSRKAVVPKYGFPVDVVELDTQRTQQNQESSAVALQRDLAIAIAEFAPTSKLVANKKMWTSYGLKRVAEREWDRKFYKRCPRHNIFDHWRKGEPEPPNKCGDRLTVCEYVIPKFGFITSRDRPKEPTSRPMKMFSTRPYFAGLRGSDPGTVTLPPRGEVVALKKASPGLMVVLCEGRHGGGFYICGTCGAGFRHRENRHKTPYGEWCGGSLGQVSLGHEFETDVLQLQFLIHPQTHSDLIWFTYSLACALVEGAAEVLEAPSTDLSATVGYGSQQDIMPPIVLYDDVPGGAGLVGRLEREEVLWASLEAAQKRVNGNCGCDENTSCYGCLRSYRNQFAHQNLQRGPVADYLAKLLLAWAPDSATSRGLG